MNFLLSNNNFIKHAGSLYQKINISLLPGGGIEATFVAKFALFIAALLFITIVVGKILKIIFKLPVVAGQIIGGIILGPTLLNIKNIPFFSQSLDFVDTTKHQIYSVASSDLFFFFILLISSGITVSYLLWLAGHETDIKDMAKVGIESTLAGFLAAILPIFLISTTVYLFLGKYYSFASCMALGVVFAATSVSIPIAMLIARNKMHLRSSKATMGAAIVDDILAIILLSLFIILVQGGFFGRIHEIKYLTQLSHTSGIGSSLLHMLLAFAIMFTIGRLFISPLTSWLVKAKLSHLIPPFAALMMFSFFSLSELVGGLAGITGAYFAGFFHRMGDHQHKAVRAVSPFVNTILLPIFLGTIGMQVNIGLLKPMDFLVVFLLLFVAIVSKLAGCHLTTFITNFFIKEKNKKWKFWESFILGSSMAARGEVALIIATILNGTHLITPNQYIICVAVIVLTTIVSPIMLSIGFKKLEEQEKMCPIEFSQKIGPFKHLSSRYVFDIICAQLERGKKMQPIIAFSEGKKILTLKNDTKIILEPEKGITFKGKEFVVREILNKLKNALNQDFELIPGTEYDEFT